MPDSIYTEDKRNNDYTDDINSRSWIQNYLSGGSIFNPEQEGIRVPIELSLAVHSDAGFNRQDTIIGKTIPSSMKTNRNRTLAEESQSWHARHRPHS